MGGEHGGVAVMTLTDAAARRMEGGRPGRLHRLSGYSPGTARPKGEVMKVGPRAACLIILAISGLAPIANAEAASSSRHTARHTACAVVATIPVGVHAFAVTERHLKFYDRATGRRTAARSPRDVWR